MRRLFPKTGHNESSGFLKNKRGNFFDKLEARMIDLFHLKRGTLKATKIIAKLTGEKNAPIRRMQQATTLLFSKQYEMYLRGCIIENAAMQYSRWSQTVTSINAWISAFATRFRPGLRKITYSIVRDHYNTNRALRKYCYSPARRLVRWLDENFAPAVVSVLVLYGFLAAISYLAYPLSFGPVLPDSVSNYFRDLVTFNAVLLGIQATFVGLLFPIVIALVSLLNNGRLTYENRLRVFLAETESAFVGRSALLFVIVVTAQFLLFSQMPDRVGATLSAVNLIWFVLNVLIIGFFLFQTIQFVQPKRRFEMVKRHISNQVWKVQLSSIVLENQWSNAIHYGYWPDPATLFPRDDERPVITTHLFQDEVDFEVTFKAPKTKFVHDIYLHRIGYVLEGWLKRFAAQNTETRFSMIELPLSPGAEVLGDVTLAQITKGPDLTERERTLLRSSFRLRRELKTESSADVLDALEELVSDLIILSEEGRVREFEKLLEHLSDLHAFLYQIAEDETGKEVFNYSNMEDRVGRSLSLRWAGIYRDLHRTAVSGIPETTEFFTAMAYWSPRLLMRLDGMRLGASRTAALLNAAHLLRQLLDWAKLQHQRATGEATNAGASFSLAPQFAQNYAAAWRSFTAAWERMVSIWRLESKKSDADWEELKAYRNAVSEHLFYSAQFVAQAAAFGDLLGSQWAIDVLLKWDGLLKSGERRANALLEIRTEGFTLDDFNKDWEAVRAEVKPKYAGPAGERHVSELEPRIVWTAVLENQWHDVRTGLLLVMIRWASDFGNEGQAVETFNRLNDGRVFDQGWHGGRDSISRTFDDHLESILRISSSGHSFSESSYIATLNHWLERYLSVGREGYVSMRIYTGSGGADFATMFGQQAILLAATLHMTDGTAHMPAAFRQFLELGLDDERLRLVKDHLEKIDHWLDLNAESDRLAIIAAIARGEALIPQRVARLRHLLRLCLRALEDRRTEGVAEARIDPDRLASVAAAASSLAFTREAGAFPLTRFRDIETTPEALEPFTLRALGQNRGEYTAPLFAQPVSNEESYWQNAMRLRVASVILFDVLRQSEFTEIAAPDPERFWQALEQGVAAVRAAGAQPILIVPGRADPEWLSEWAWDQDPGVWRPETLNIWREESDDEAYVFHINDLPVYVAPLPSGAAYILVDEVFQAARFREQDGRMLEVEFHGNENDAWTGELHLKFERGVDINQASEMFKLRYREDDES